MLLRKQPLVEEIIHNALVCIWVILLEKIYVFTVFCFLLLSKVLECTIMHHSSKQSGVNNAAKPQLGITAAGRPASGFTTAEDFE